MANIPSVPNIPLRDNPSQDFTWKMWLEKQRNQINALGTGSYTIGDIVYANSTTTLANLSDVATGNALISGGVGAAPSWGKIGISTHVSGLGTNVATFLGTPSSANLAAALTDETGSGAAVFATSPTLVTPVLGVASATTINKVAFTAPATGSTLTILDGKTLTVNKSLTLDGTDSTTMTFPTTSATIARTDTGQTFTGNNLVNGNLRVGSAVAPTVALDVTGAVLISSTLGVSGNTTFSGKVGINTVPTNNCSLNINNVNATGATQIAINTTGFQSSSGATANTVGIWGDVTTVAASYTTTNLISFLAVHSAKGAGSTITNEYGYYCADLTQGATLIAGYLSLISSGAGKWNIYSSGTANSAFAGNVRIGSTTAPTVALDVTGAALISTTLGVTGIITSSGGITMADAKDIVVNATTGTKIGTATTQKLGFWNATPVAQQAGTGETVGFTAGGGTTVTDASTFTGNVGSTAYRISDVVKALKNIGAMAA